jgi:hypothetical protein
LFVFFFLLQVTIVKLKMDKNRKLTIDRKAKGRQIREGKGKGKYTEETAMDTTKAPSPAAPDSPAKEAPASKTP